MDEIERQSQSVGEPGLQLIQLAELAVSARSIKEFAENALPVIAGIVRSPSVLMYVADPRLSACQLFQHGLKPASANSIKELCAWQFHRALGQDSPPNNPALSETAADLTFYPLRSVETCFGLIGLTTSSNPTRPELWQILLRFITGAIKQIEDRVNIERQLALKNSYLTVSSMLSQSMGLQELLETALYCCMDVVSAEAASVLLLDDEKKNFRFYQVEGPTKPVLMAATFPADRGIAGAVLQTQQSEVINDVRSDPRFYGNIDTQSGFRTRNMIAVPLVAEKEKIGVLEILNKIDEGSFSEEEHLLLRSMAEEIAFAIRNAKLFEYIADNYCKQRQGQASCKGCMRPLGSWTPCVKYRQIGL